MGELGRELEILLRGIFLSIWRNLGEKTQHRIEVLGAAVLVLGLVNAIRQDLQSKANRQHLQSSQASLRVAGREAGKLVAGGWREIKTLCRPLLTPANPEFLPAVVFLLLAASTTWPYNFYVLTRIVVCPTLIWITFLIHKKQPAIWEILVVFFALIFNPIAPFHFARETWALLNILAVITIVPAIYLHLKTGSEALAIKLETRQIEAALPPTTLAKSNPRSYKYCDRCSVRIGKSDSFCKHCGNTL